MIKSFKIQWLPLAAVLVMVCAAMFIFSVPAHAQGETSCHTVSATKARPYVVQSGETAEPGNGKVYVANAMVWGRAIKVCTPNSDDAGGDGPTQDTTAGNPVPTVSAPQGAGNASNANNWQLTWYKGATLQMKGEGSIPWAPFPALDPNSWPEFPNVANAAKGFPAAWGLEYGMDEHQFCGAQGDMCELVVAAGGYALGSGDWELDGLGKCNAPEGQGCAVFLIDVGEVSSSLKGKLNNIFVVTGRYWHGDHTPEATVGALSHAVWNMTNGESKLNPAGSVNAGANCSVRKGCQSINAQFFVLSGNEVLIHGETNWSR